MHLWYQETNDTGERTGTVGLSGIQHHHRNQAKQVYDDERPEMFPITGKRNVHKTKVNVGITRVFIEWDPLYNKKGHKYEIQVSK